jgi:hypothetical protein
VEAEETMAEAEDPLEEIEVGTVEEEAMEEEIIKDLVLEISLIRQTIFLKKILLQLKSEDFLIKQGMMRFLISLKILNTLIKV